MTSPSKAVIIVLAIISAITLSAGLGYQYASAHYKKIIAERERDASERYSKLEGQYRDQEKSHAARIAEIDQNYTEKLENVQAKNKADLAALTAGTLQLRDRFNCDTNLSRAGTSPGMGDGEAGSGLRSEDAAFLISESDRADAITIKLQACQQILLSDRRKP